jgi:hypothetical protein
METANDIALECSTPGWDGYDALPVQQDTISQANKFLVLLPNDFPRPTLGAEPDGCVTLEWYHSGRRTLSVSATSCGLLHYAALVGPDRFFGTLALKDKIPDRILDLIRLIFPE